MSYDLRILRDNPIGYWSFNGTLNDLTSASNHASGTGIQYTSPPIIANSGSSLRINNSSSVTIGNSSKNYQFITNYSYKNIFTIAFWFNLNNQLTGAGSSSNPYTSNKLKLINIKVAGNDLGGIYYDYLSNTIRFGMTPISTTQIQTEAYCVLNNNDLSYYVVATYSEGNLYLTVNGKEGAGGTVKGLDSTIVYNSNQLSFTIDGTSSIISSSTTPSNFLINSLAFFNYKLRPEQIRSHMVWAGNNGKPNYQGTISPDTSLFDLDNKVDELGNRKVISGLDFSKNGYYKNLAIDEQGLKPFQLDNATFYKSSYSNTTPSYTINTTNGITIVGNAGVLSDEFLKQISTSSGVSIGMQIVRTKPVNETLFEIQNLTNKAGRQCDIRVDYEYTSGSAFYKLSSFFPDTQSSSVAINLFAGASTTSTNLGLYLGQSGAFLYVSDNSGKTAGINYIRWWNGPFDFGAYPRIFVGNTFINYGVSSIKDHSTIKNFGVIEGSPNSESGFKSTFDFVSASSYTRLMKFTNSSNPFKITQFGCWEYVIPVTNVINCYLLGTAIDWSGMDNVLVKTSIDGGKTYSNVVRQQPITALPLTGASKNVNVRVEIESDYTVDEKSQAFNNFEYVLYKNLSFFSNGFFYSLSNNSNNFVVSNNINNNILNRPKNFGLRFYGDSNKMQGNATIDVPTGASYSAIEFWYRPEKIISSASNYILNNILSATASPSIWINTSSKFESLGGTLYINGASVAQNSITASAGELYHITLLLSSPQTSSLYLNGYNWSNTASSSFGTFGNIQFWNTSVSSSTVLERYSSFVGRTASAIIDNNTNKIYSASLSDRFVITKIGSIS